MPELYESLGVKTLLIKDFKMRRSIGMRWPKSNTNETIKLFYAFARSHRWK